MQRCETPWRSVRSDVLQGASLPGTRKPEYTSCILGAKRHMLSPGVLSGCPGHVGHSPLASGLKCAWPDWGQPWTSAAWPPWVWREDGWTGLTMDERRTAGNRLCRKTQCGEAASLGGPWAVPRRGIMVCSGKKSRGFPLPPQVCSTDSMETETRTPCPCPWAHTPSSYSRQEDRATCLP